MRMNLRRIREFQHKKIKELADSCNMDVERLRAIENYRELPTYFELCRILKNLNHYFDEIYHIIWRDIEEHYRPQTYNEYSKIQESLKLEDLTTEDLERKFNDGE